MALGAGGLLGGYLGARPGRRLPAATVRWGTVGVCDVITGLFFVRAHARR